jgi:carboxyl-terminal processing protease
MLSRKDVLVISCTTIAAVCLARSVNAVACVHAGELPYALEIPGDSSPLVSQLDKPPSHHEFIVKEVKRLIEKSHLLRPEFNDEISARGFKTFLKRLDPEHAYFLASDIEDFQPFESNLADEIREGKLTFAYFVYKRFLERMDQVMPIIRQQIYLVHDFTAEETVSTKMIETGNAKDANELAERWRKAIKQQIRTSRSEEKSDDQIKATLYQDYGDFYRDRSRMTADELLELYLTSITNAFDPHTNYRSPRSQEDFLRQQKLEMRGIGATLKQVEGKTFVESLVPGGAAEIDGRIKMGDRLVAVAQEGGAAPVEIQDMKVTDVAGLIRGPVGTRVQIHVQPREKEKIEVIELTRALISMESSAAKFEVAETIREDGSRYRLGVITLLGFYLDSDGAKNRKANYRSATRDLRAIIVQLRQMAIDGIILDLGRNDSGALVEAISATGLFIDHGPVVQVKGPDGAIEVLEDLDKGVAWDGPLVIKISQATTSASEVFTGAIQDYGRGLVVGAPQTHGKGTVQQIIDIEPEASGEPTDRKLGALRMTIKQFFLPSGRSTQLAGVPSDVVLPSSTRGLPISERELDYPLSAVQVARLPFVRYSIVDEAMKQKLQKGSALRIGDAEEFIRSNLIPFESNAERHQTFAGIRYNQEILNVARDYLDELRIKKNP